MLAIQVRLLAGRYVATKFDDRDRAEWPPHPARIFAAAVSAWADTESPNAEERAALEWWESLGDPQVTCSDPEQVAERGVVTHYVPVNDATALSRDSAGAYAQLTAALEARRAAEEADPKRREQAIQRATRAESKARAQAAALAAGSSAPVSGLQVLPDQRIRQARTFPSVTPSDDVILYTWPQADGASPYVPALDAVLSRVARLGHSSSPVDIAVVSGTDAAATLEPSDAGDLSLRTVAPGQLAALEDAYAEHQGREPRILPVNLARYRRRRETPGPPPATVFDPDRWLLFECSPRRPLLSAPALTRALRDAIMAYSDQPPPEIITGHRPDPELTRTAPSDQPHAAYLALPYVASSHADGAIHAVAIVLPRTVSEHDRAAVARAAAAWLQRSATLRLGRAGAVAFSRLDPDEASRTARPSTWTRPSREWSTATPIALDRHPGSLGDRDPVRRTAALRQAEQSVRRACRNIGLPEPTEVTIRTDAPLVGTRPARAFPPFVVGGKLRRFLVHADLRFPAPVRGPVLLGSGRYFGYGLCRPVPSADDG